MSQHLRILRRRDHRLLVTRLALVAAITGVLLPAASLIPRQGAEGASTGRVPGIGVLRNGNAYPTGSGYDRYSYIIVGVKDAAAAGSLSTKSLVYMSGTSVQTSWSTGVSYSEALANNWLLKDTNGSAIRTPYNAYVGDVGNAAYQQRFISNVASVLSSNGDDGVFVDDVLASLTAFTHTAPPAKYPTQQAWEDAMVSFISTVGSGLKARGFYVVANASAFIPGDASSDDGTGYARFYERLAPSLNGIMSEFWMQVPTNTSQLRASGTSSWMQHWDGWLDLASRTQKAGADFFTVMYGSTTSLNIMRYGKASFLLAWDGGGGAFIYEASGDPWNPEWTTDIGTPSGLKYQVGVGWRRDYTGGTVVLNPSPSSSQTFTLGGTYVRADGVSVSSVTLAPLSALILKSTNTATAIPPANTALPTISGSAQEGVDLSASTGTWSGAPTAYGYQWKRCDSAGAACVAVSGATSSKYTPATADVGRRLRVTVSATNAGGSSSATSDPSSLVAAATPVPTALAPANVTLPAISGSAQEGLDLVASTGSWTNGPTAYGYQWKRCDPDGPACTAISATAATYTPVAADVGRRLRVTVTASNTAGAASATSYATEIVVPAVAAPPPSAAPVNTALPTVSGVAEEGRDLSGTAGTWTNSPTGYGYQWKRCDSTGAACSPIVGATAAAYRLVTADVGHRLRLTVTASNPGGTSSATSAATAVIGAAPTPPPSSVPANTALPALDGTPEDGRKLTASRGSWTNAPTTYAYQWRRCDASGGACNAIGAATSSKYTLTGDDVGHTVRVTVLASNAAGAASATSDPSQQVATRHGRPSTKQPAASQGPANTALPTLSGTAQQGSELSSASGSWSNGPSGYTYQWKRCDPSGDACASIAGATSVRYRLDAPDVGHRLRVTVSASNAGGSASATSAPSSVVSPAPAPRFRPVNVEAPSISGRFRVGQELMASPGAWKDASSFRYQWRRCTLPSLRCVDIEDADDVAYEPSADDEGFYLMIVVTASNEAGRTTASFVSTKAVRD